MDFGGKSPTLRSDPACGRVKFCKALRTFGFPWDSVCRSVLQKHPVLRGLLHAAGDLHNSRYLNPVFRSIDPQHPASPQSRAESPRRTKLYLAAAPMANRCAWLPEKQGFLVGPRSSGPDGRPADTGYRLSDLAAQRHGVRCGRFRRATSDLRVPSSFVPPASWCRSPRLGSGSQLWLLSRSMIVRTSRSERERRSSFHTTSTSSSRS